MATITMQRDLVLTLKRETFLNVGILSKVHPMPGDLSRQVFKENALEKLTQNVFNNLSYYLVSVIDPPASSALPWPLYDTKTERTYRNELSIFITDYSNKGLLSPVISSYLVNPGCYKVTFLIFQLSQLAVQRYVSKMGKNHQKSLYDDMTEKYKSQTGEGFIKSIEKETEIMHSKFSNYLCKRQTLETIAGLFRKRITQMEENLESLKAQEYINSIVDTFVTQNKLDKDMTTEILNARDVNKPSQFFESWLNIVDNEMQTMETEWENKVTPFLNMCRLNVENTEALIARQTGEADRKSFTIEYNPKTDDICTKDLQNQMNSQQKYILKNIVKDKKLIFPNLIRGFLISICFILKNAEIGDEIYKFNEYLEGGRRNYSEVISAMRILVERVLNAESRLQHTPSMLTQPVSMREYTDIPPLPDLSDLKMNRDFHSHAFDTFTPLNINKHQFNLRRKHTTFFTKPLPRSLLITPFHHGPRDDFLKSVISCRVSAYDRQSTIQSLHNMSVISQPNRGNETIAECSSGFTKQQICRLLSTKKSSSSKKYKFKKERPAINVKKGGLFNESTLSNDSTGLTRSHSSPNLFENREKRSFSKSRARKLSIMKEDSPSLLEVSGVTALERESRHSTPQGITGLEVSRKLTDSSSMPLIKSDVNEVNSNTSDREVSLKKELENDSIDSKIIPQRLSWKVADMNDFVDLNKEITNNSIESKMLPERFSWKTTTTNDSMVDLNKETEYDSIATKIPQRLSWKVAEELLDGEENLQEQAKIVTPKTNTNIIRKTSSLEKIINRFKKVRASVLPMDSKEDYCKEIKSIVEEKENFNAVNVDVFTANRILLPDLLSPSCSMLAQKSSDYSNQLCLDSDEERPRRPRESLGTALGVDHTFLDQFELID